MKETKTQEITDILTDEGIEKIKVGNILRFKVIDTEGKKEKMVELKITKKAKRRVWARETVTFDVDDIAITGKKNLWGRRKRKTVREELTNE